MRNHARPLARRGRCRRFCCGLQNWKRRESAKLRKLRWSRCASGRNECRSRSVPKRGTSWQDQRRRVGQSNASRRTSEGKSRGCPRLAAHQSRGHCGSLRRNRVLSRYQNGIGWRNRANARPRFRVGCCYARSRHENSIPSPSQSRARSCRIEIGPLQRHRGRSLR
jgi:hypothetical protein